MQEPMVQIKNIYKSFGKLAVLKGINLDVQPGQVVCIVGPSGSGKSTLLRCINHLEHIDAGRIYVAGKLVGYTEKDGKVYEKHEREICQDRASIGMVFQNFNLYSHKTVLENVMLGPTLVKKEPKEIVLERAISLLRKVGLESKLNNHPIQLSGGEQQRVAIARALSMQPKLMLFDEPTSALDPELVGEVLDTMRELAIEGITMIVVTHEIGFAREVGDELIFMDGGIVVEAGSPRDVISHPQQERTREFFSKLL
jgi:polar amino acid transport system ATP-binding protein